MDRTEGDENIPNVADLDIHEYENGGFRYCFSHNKKEVCVIFNTDDQIDQFSFEQSKVTTLYAFDNRTGGVEKRLFLIPGTDTGIKYTYDSIGQLREIVEYKLYSERVVNQFLEYNCSPDHANSQFYQIKNIGKNRFQLFVQSTYGGNNGNFIIGKVNSKRTGVLEAKSDTMQINNGELEFFHEQEIFEGIIFIEHVINDSLTRGYPIFVSYPKDPDFTLPDF